MSYITLVCDVDGVLADIHTPWIEWYNDQYQDTLTPQDLHSWDIHQWVKPECGYHVYDYLKQRNIYENIKPIPDALYYVTHLRQLGIRVVFCSAQENISAQRRWLIDNDFLGANYRDDFIACTDKSMIRGELLIDDAAHNLAGFHGVPLLFSHPHNKATHVITRHHAGVKYDMLEDQDFFRVRGWRDLFHVLLQPTVFNMMEQVKYGQAVTHYRGPNFPKGHQ